MLFMVPALNLFGKDVGDECCEVDSPILSSGRVRGGRGGSKDPLRASVPSLARRAWEWDWL